MRKIIFIIKHIVKIRASAREWESADYERRDEIGKANNKILQEYISLFGEIDDVSFSKFFFTRREIRRMLTNGTL